jgi:hypothetical protein
MPTLDLYDSFGCRSQCDRDRPLHPGRPQSFRIGPLTYGDTVATGSVTGTLLQSRSDHLYGH